MKKGRILAESSIRNSLKKVYRAALSPVTLLGPGLPACPWVGYYNIGAMLKTSKQSQLIFNGVSLHLHLIGLRYCSQLSRRFLRWNAPELKSRSLLFLLRKANPMHWYSCVQLGDTLQLLTNLTHERCLWLPLHGGSPRCQSTLFEMQACENLFLKLCMSRPNSF